MSARRLCLTLGGVLAVAAAASLLVGDVPILQLLRRDPALAHMLIV